MSVVAPLRLFCDTDCLIQLLHTKQEHLLGELRRRCGLQAVVVPEVELELMWHPKFKERFAGPLENAIAKGLVARFDYNQASSYDKLAGADELARAVQSRGVQYGKVIDTGEAYCHACATLLNSPVLSHDMSAIRTLKARGLPVPKHVLGVADLLCFAAESGLRSDSECNRVIKGIRAMRKKPPNQETEKWEPAEWLPREFKSSPFVKGKASFSSRLRLKARERSAAAADDVLWLTVDQV